MKNFTTLSVDPEIADKIRELREGNDHKNTSDTLRNLIQQGSE